jgi:hypothetical protein
MNISRDYLNKFVVVVGIAWLTLGITLLFLVKHWRHQTSTQASGQAISWQKQHASTHRIGIYSVFEAIDDLGKAHCSGTAVAKHALLTAQHCFHNSNEVLLDDSWRKNIIVAAFPDGNDHVILLLDHTFYDYASISQRELVPGEKVGIFGNPGHRSDVYHTGYFDSMRYYKDFDRNFQVFELPVFRGDSGAGIFDEKGRVISVVSLSNESSEAVSLPLSFSENQLRAIEQAAP